MEILATYSFSPNLLKTCYGLNVCGPSCSYIQSLSPFRQHFKMRLLAGNWVKFVNEFVPPGCDGLVQREGDGALPLILTPHCARGLRKGHSKSTFPLQIQCLFLSLRPYVRQSQILTRLRTTRTIFSL